MPTALVQFQCASCGHSCFRYRAVYDQMLAACGRATCLLCPLSAYVAPPSRPELLAVAQALNARSRELLSVQRPGSALRPRGELLY